MDLVKVIKNNILFCDLPEDIIRQELLPLSTRQPYERAPALSNPATVWSSSGSFCPGASI